MQEKNDSMTGFEQVNPTQDNCSQNNTETTSAVDVNDHLKATQKNEQDIKTIEALIIDTQSSYFFSPRKPVGLSSPKETPPSKVQPYSPFHKQ